MLMPPGLSLTPPALAPPAPWQMKAAAGSLHGIIDTVSAPHDLTTYIALLRTSGKYVVVGVPPEPYALPAGVLIFSEWKGGTAGVGWGGKGCLHVCCTTSGAPLDHICWLQCWSAGASTSARIAIFGCCIS